MARFCSLMVTCVALLGLWCQGVEAGPRAPDRNHYHIGPFDVGNPKVFAVGVGVGAASTGAYFAITEQRHPALSAGAAFVLTSIGCAAVAPIIAALVIGETEHRELTSREAMRLALDCFIPFIGGLLVNAAFDAHPEWEQSPLPTTQVRPRRRDHR
jgi:hypothetical protein